MTHPESDSRELRLEAQRNAAFATAAILSAILVVACWALEVVPRRKAVEAQAIIDSLRARISDTDKALLGNQAALKQTEKALTETQTALRMAIERSH